MTWLNKSIQTKLAFTIISGALLIGLVSLYAWYHSSQSIRGFSELVGAEAKQEAGIHRLHSHFQQQILEWNRVLLRGFSSRDFETHWSQFEQLESQIQSEVLALQAVSADEQTKSLLKQFAAEHRAIGGAYREARMRYLESDRDTQVGDLLVRDVEQKASELLRQAVQALEQSADQDSQVIADKALTESLLILSLTLVIIVVVTIAILAISRISIVNPSTQLIKVIDRISSGILSDKISIHRDDELGQLAEASRRLQGFLRHIAERLNETNAQLLGAAGELGQATEGVSDKVDAAHRSTEHVASAMTEMSATALEVSRHAAGAAQLATEANKAAQEGLRAMQTAEASINNLAEQVEHTVETVKRLAQDTSNVGTVLSVIRGIAEQTNLLALNAAIEAARAGDQGRGFAVVADEVRNLAQKTQQSTAEIEQIIENVQNGAHNTVEVMDASSAITSESAKLFKEAADKLVIITSSISQINDLNTQVATAAEEQNSVAEDITRTVVEVSDLVEATSDTAEKTSGTAQRLMNMARESEGLSKSFSL